MYRVEGSHFALKQYMHSSQGNLSTIFNEYHMMLDNQVREIHGTLNKSMRTQLTSISGADLFKLLHYKVSPIALERLIDEYKNGQLSNPCPICKCHKNIRDGLACFRIIGKFVENQVPIPLDSIHPFWRTLSVSETPEQIDEEIGRAHV